MVRFFYGRGSPSLYRQQKIAVVVANADLKIELLEQQLADLKQEKKALMQQLLTGKRRVKVEQTGFKANQWKLKN